MITCTIISSCQSLLEVKNATHELEAVALRQSSSRFKLASVSEHMGWREKRFLDLLLQPIFVQTYPKSFQCKDLVTHVCVLCVFCVTMIMSTTFMLTPQKRTVNQNNY